MAAVANRGRLPRPRVAGHRRPQLRNIGLELSESDWRAIVDGMVAAVHVPGGTAYAAFNNSFAVDEPSFMEEFPYVGVAGKTGTAEHGLKRPGRTAAHSWFACFAPARSPEVALAVVIEHGGRGGGTAARSAARILSAYFRCTRSGERAP